MPTGLLSRVSRRAKNILGRSGQTPELVADSPFETVLHALRTEYQQGRIVRLRDIHRLTGMTQPDALRCVEQLKNEGQVHVETMLLDPLAGVISLK